jgi:hypothetical protein
MTQSYAFRTCFRKTMQLLWLILAGYGIAPNKGFCQSDLPNFETSGQFVLLHYPSFNRTDSGFGGRFAYNISRFLAVESEFNIFPQKRPVLNSFNDPALMNYIDSRRMEGLFGIKAGLRGKHFGIFAKARPGFFYISEGELHIKPNIVFFRAPEEADSQFNFSTDLGGVVEMYTSRRTFIRFDAGDTMIQFTRSPFGERGMRDFTSHNLQLNIGWGFRF